jgi:hypothetical protein
LKASPKTIPSPSPMVKSINPDPPRSKGTIRPDHTPPAPAPGTPLFSQRSLRPAGSRWKGGPKAQARSGPVRKGN